MNQNSFTVSLINFKETVFRWYEKREKVLRPVFKGLVAFVVLYMTFRMFPCRSVSPVSRLYVILAVLSLLSALLPFSLLYYLASGVILYNLWEVSFDIFAAFAIFFVVCAVGYFRIDGDYSYLAAIVPVLFFLNVGMAIPAVLAVAIGLEALFPTLVGVAVYYFSLSIKDASLALGGNDTSGVGVGLQQVIKSLSADKLFMVMILSTCAAILITGLLRKAFYERAWLVAATIGNTAMVCLVFAGCMYCDVEIEVWLVIVEAVAGMLLCLLVEFFRGIGDVNRSEKTVFEDEEYIYYVKAVPKLKVSRPEPNVKNMNESLYEDSFEEDKPEEETGTQSQASGADQEAAGDSPAVSSAEQEPSAGSPETEDTQPADPPSTQEKESSEEQTERSGME